MRNSSNTDYFQLACITSAFLAVGALIWAILVMNGLRCEIDQLKGEKANLQTSLKSYRDLVNVQRLALLEPLPKGVPDLFPGCDTYFFNRKIDFVKKEQRYLTAPLIFPEFEGEGKVLGIIVVIPPGKKLPIPFLAPKGAGGRMVRNHIREAN